MRALLLALLLCLGTASAWAAAPPEFQDANEEARFRALTNELRCVMCQNQSLADSDAMIAVDLRQQVLTQIREGRSDDEIKDYLVSRYGEFVLYQPRLAPSTLLLWFGPLLVVLAGAAVVVTVVRRRGRQRDSAQGAATAEPGPDEPEQEQEW